MRRYLVSFMIVVLLGCSSAEKQKVSVNTILPSPTPKSPLADWTANPTRTPIEISVPGAMLRGWTFRAVAQSPQKLRILFFNGNAMTIDGSQSLYRSLAVHGADVTVFDYRGYGFSTGKPDVMDFRRDALVLYDSLAKDGPVVVYGFSLGTAIATYVASQRKVAGLILAGTIATAQEEFPVFAHAEGFGPEQIANMIPSQDALAAFNEIGLIATNQAPLLMLHGDADQLVPIQQGREVFAASPVRQKTFVPIPGAGHNETAGSPLALEAIHSFLSAVESTTSHPKT
jgi:pimeloyl-ACP methyl ester carboxylesterase